MNYYSKLLYSNTDLDAVSRMRIETISAKKIVTIL